MAGLCRVARPSRGCLLFHDDFRNCTRAGHRGKQERTLSPPWSRRHHHVERSNADHPLWLYTAHWLYTCIFSRLADSTCSTCVVESSSSCSSSSSSSSFFSSSFSTVDAITFQATNIGRLSPLHPSPSHPPHHHHHHHHHYYPQQPSQYEISFTWH